jgi:hypothetical protein
VREELREAFERKALRSQRRAEGGGRPRRRGARRGGRARRRTRARADGDQRTARARARGVAPTSGTCRLIACWNSSLPYAAPLTRSVS